MVLKLSEYLYNPASMKLSTEPDYLQPYADAARVHGGDFASLLWASPRTQAARFHAMRRMVTFHQRSILDVGCGRADFFDYLLAVGDRPDHYTGIEAVPDLAMIAAGKKYPDYLILQADFIVQPARLFTGAEVIVVCGALNTLGDDLFFEVLNNVAHTGTDELIFNFLSSPYLAGRNYLHWRRPEVVEKFCSNLGAVEILEDYLEGDCTVRIEF